MCIHKKLGRHVRNIIDVNPYDNWPVKKTYEANLDEKVVHYVFYENGMELRCWDDETVNTIFLHSTEYGGFNDSLFDIPFRCTRPQVLELYGIPQKSGEQTTDTILGDTGAWDLFHLPMYNLHCQYELNTGTIKLVTLTSSPSISIV